MNLSNALKTAKNVITANSPQLLVGTAIVGVVTTGVLAAKGGYKARGVIDEAESERDTPLNFQEKAQLTWLCFAPSVLTGASTIAATVGVHTIHTKRHAALAGLYAIGASKSDELQAKAEELLGAKKSQLLEDHLAQKAVDRDFEQRGEEFLNHEVIVTGKGEQLCREDFTGRYFDGSLNSIESAVNDLNAILLDGPADMNNLFDYLGIEPSAAGEVFGWKPKTKVMVKPGSALTPKGKAVINVRFHPAATTSYEN